MEPFEDELGYIIQKAISQMPNLKSLHLDLGRLSDEGRKELFKVVYHTKALSLRELFIDGCSNSSALILKGGPLVAFSGA